MRFQLLSAVFIELNKADDPKYLEIYVVVDIHWFHWFVKELTYCRKNLDYEANVIGSHNTLVPADLI